MSEKVYIVQISFYDYFSPSLYVYASMNQAVAAVERRYGPSLGEWEPYAGGPCRKARVSGNDQINVYISVEEIQ